MVDDGEDDCKDRDNGDDAFTRSSSNPNVRPPPVRQGEDIDSKLREHQWWIKNPKPKTLNPKPQNFNKSMDSENQEMNPWNWMENSWGKLGD